MCDAMITCAKGWHKCMFLRVCKHCCSLACSDNKSCLTSRLGLSIVQRALFICERVHRQSRREADAQARQSCGVVESVGLSSMCFLQRWVVIRSKEELYVKSKY